MKKILNMPNILNSSSRNAYIVKNIYEKHIYDSVCQIYLYLMSNNVSSACSKIRIHILKFLKVVMFDNVILKNVSLWIILYKSNKLRYKTQ